MIATRDDIPTTPADGLLGERLIELSQAARLLPTRRGKRIHRTTLWRWATKGVSSPLTPPRVRVRLETIKIGATRYTSIEALERFAAASDDGLGRGTLDPQTAAGLPRNNRRRRRDVAAAKRELAQAGWM